MSTELKIIGTSHIAAESIQAVKNTIKELKPDIVCLELDPRRAHALLHNHKARLSLKLAKSIGIKGFLFLAIASFLQKRIGKIVGVEPGAEMKTALHAAIENNIKIALIDRDIEITLKRLSKAVTWKEKIRFVTDFIKSPFSKEFSEFRIDLRKVPGRQVIEAALTKLKKSYPSLYKALVEERNEHMAERLATIIKANPDTKILAVVGAGHETELAELTKKKMEETAHQRI